MDRLKKLQTTHVMHLGVAVLCLALTVCVPFAVAKLCDLLQSAKDLLAATQSQTLPKVNKLADDGDLVIAISRDILTASKPKIATSLTQSELGLQQFRALMKGESDEWFEPVNVLSRKHALQVGDQLIEAIGDAREFVQRTDQSVNGERGVLIALRKGIEDLASEGKLTLDDIHALLADPDWQATSHHVASTAKHADAILASVESGTAHLPAIGAHAEGMAANTEDVTRLIKEYLATQNKANKIILALRIIGAVLPIAGVR